MFNWLLKWFRKPAAAPANAVLASERIELILRQESMDADIIAQAIARARRWEANSVDMSDSILRRCLAWARSEQRLREP